MSRFPRVARRVRSLREPLDPAEMQSRPLGELLDALRDRVEDLSVATEATQATTNDWLLLAVYNLRKADND